MIRLNHIPPVVARGECEKREISTVRPPVAVHRLTKVDFCNRKGSCSKSGGKVRLLVQSQKEDQGRFGYHGREGYLLHSQRQEIWPDNDAKYDFPPDQIGVTDSEQPADEPDNSGKTRCGMSSSMFAFYRH